MAIYIALHFLGDTNAIDVANAIAIFMIWTDMVIFAK
jgi:hypothetical protein